MTRVCVRASHSEEKGRGKGAFAKVRSEKVKSEMCHGEKTKNTTERVQTARVDIFDEMEEVFLGNYLV